MGKKYTQNYALQYIPDCTLVIRFYIKYEQLQSAVSSRQYDRLIAEDTAPGD